MRESLFSILGDITGDSFLDLFSGSGLMGVEAASRGVAVVHAVEKDFRKKRIFLSNIAIAQGRIIPYFCPVETYLKRENLQFNVIFCDPPFPYQGKSGILQLIINHSRVAAGGRVLIHYPKNEDLSEHYGTLLLEDIRDYGHSRVAFYRQEGEGGL